MTIEFIEITNKTCDELSQAASLWVVDKIPFQINEVQKKVIAIAQAKASDNFDRLEKKWLESLLVVNIPRSAIKRAKLLDEYASRQSGLVFIVNDANLLTADNLQLMRLLPEKNITVFLVGDISVIDIKTRKHPSFTLRAEYGIHASKI